MTANFLPLTQWKHRNALRVCREREWAPGNYPSSYPRLPTLNPSHPRVGTTVTTSPRHCPPLPHRPPKCQNETLPSSGILYPPADEGNGQGWEHTAPVPFALLSVWRPEVGHSPPPPEVPSPARSSSRSHSLAVKYLKDKPTLRILL